MSQDREILWGPPQQRQVLSTGATIDAAARDAGNDITTVLRRGLLMGKVTATGSLKEYDPAASDGTEDVYGVLNVELTMVDTLGQATDRHAPIIISAPLKTKQLLLLGDTLLGHGSEAAAIADLTAKSCVLDSVVL